ncbi:MAG: hypothetical protein R2820_11740 [Cyclobacteriaceae bacterium]|nr:hypothetical protein [Cyclobacteriaceae bacterium]
MNNSIDSFFREKLGEHSVAPDANAWSRIEGSLSKKNKAVVWFRAAAALALIAMGTWLFYNINATTESNQAVAETKPEVKTNETAQPKEEEQVPNQLPVVTDDIIKNQRVARADKQKATTPKARPEEQNELPPLDLTEELNVTLADNLVIEKTEIADVVVDEKREPIVIVYELKDIAKRKPDIDFEELPERKNGLKKVWEIASDVRNGDSPIVGLRQAKEEILALNFKKDDKKNNSR